MCLSLLSISDHFSILHNCEYNYCHLVVPKWSTSSELSRLPDKADSPSEADMESIPAVPVDQLMHNLTYAQRHNSSLLSAIYNAYFNHDDPAPSNRRLANRGVSSAIDILMIDTEGHDALVIRGAKHLFKRRAIR